MIKKIIIISLCVILVLVISVNLPVISIGHKSSDIDYRNWMTETLDSETRIVDVTMLGAHDAFSSGINLFSPADKFADGIMKGFTGFLLKGFLVRQSVTQITDAPGLLQSGVRYFDIRLTLDEDEWITKHNFVSNKFEPIASDLVEFLKNNKGEFLVLDFQHINGVDYNSIEDYMKFIEMLDIAGLIDFQYFNGKGLGEVTYGEITANKSESQVVIVDKFSVPNKTTYDYEDSIHSVWADDDSFEGVIKQQTAVADKLNQTEEFNNSFKVMQAVTTMQLSLPGIGNSLKTWSLIERAEKFNEYLINHDDFDVLLETMPIVMIDYCNTNKNGLNDRIMDKIISANRER